MTLTQKVLARAEFDPDKVSAAYQEEYEAAKAENARLLPIIQELLSSNEKMAEALETVKHATKRRSGDYKKGTAPRTVANKVLSEHSRVMKGLGE